MGGCWGCTSKVELRVKANWSRSAGNKVGVAAGVVEVVEEAAVVAAVPVVGAKVAEPEPDVVVIVGAIVAAAAVPNGIGVVAVRCPCPVESGLELDAPAGGSGSGRRFWR